jgi:hypothetical protein
MQQPEDRNFEQGRLARFSWLVALVLLAGISQPEVCCESN